jgi:hypothetical protein
VNKPRVPARRLGELIGRCLSPALARQGFASTELITRWQDIVGAEIAENAAPIRIKWPRGIAQKGEPATLILRVDGPVAIEIQHLSGIILERINRFFGWRAIGRLALQQGPIKRRTPAHWLAPPSKEATDKIAAGLTNIADEDLRQALARLGAAIESRAPKHLPGKEEPVLARSCNSG